jgi:hypothetical protein
MPDEDMKLTPEEATALLAIDSSYHQRGPSPELEARLRELGLVELSRLSRHRDSPPKATRSRSLSSQNREGAGRRTDREHGPS